MTETAHKPPHPAAAYHARRRASVDDRITETVRAIAAAGTPLRDITVERVAKESGIAKTTIYRRHDDAAAMRAATLAPTVDVPAVAAIIARHVMAWVSNRAAGQVVADAARDLIAAGVPGFDTWPVELAYDVDDPDVDISSGIEAAEDLATFITKQWPDLRG